MCIIKHQERRQILRNDVLTCTDLVSNCCMKRAYWTLPSSSRGTRSRKASNCSFVSSRLKRLSMAARNSSWLIVSVPRRSIFLQWHEMMTGHHDRRSWQDTVENEWQNIERRHWKSDKSVKGERKWGDWRQKIGTAILKARDKLISTHFLQS